MGKMFNFVNQGGEFGLPKGAADEGETFIVPTIDKRKAAAFEQFRPTMYDQRYGCVQAELHAIVVDDSTFETVAYYDFIVPADDEYLRVTTYRYEIMDGVMARAQEFPTVILPKREITHRHRPRWRLMLPR